MTDEYGKAIRETLTLIFVVITTVGVFYQAYIFREQLKEMHGTSEQTNQLIEKNNQLAKAAEKQAAAAELQATALGEFGRQDRIKAAIESSLRNFQEPAIQQRRADFIAMASDKNNPTVETFNRNKSASEYVGYLNYMAQLINTGQLDLSYVDNTMRCQIFNMYEVTLQYINPAYKNFYLNRGDRREIVKFHDANPKACPE